MVDAPQPPTLMPRRKSKTVYFDMGRNAGKTHYSSLLTELATDRPTDATGFLRFMGQDIAFPASDVTVQRTARKDGSVITPITRRQPMSFNLRDLEESKLDFSKAEVAITRQIQGEFSRGAMELLYGSSPWTTANTAAVREEERDPDVWRREYEGSYVPQPADPIGRMGDGAREMDRYHTLQSLTYDLQRLQRMNRRHAELMHVPSYVVYNPTDEPPVLKAAVAVEKQVFETVGGRVARSINLGDDDG